MKLHTIESLTFRKIKFCFAKLDNFRNSYPPDRAPVWPGPVAARQTLGENIFAITHYTGQCCGHTGPPIPAISTHPLTYIIHRTREKKIRLMSIYATVSCLCMVRCHGMSVNLSLKFGMLNRLSGL